MCILSKPEIMAEFHHMCVPTHIIPGKQKHMQSQILYYVSAQNYSPMLLQKMQHKTEINRNEPKSNTICAGIGEKRQNVRKRLKVL